MVARSLYSVHLARRRLDQLLVRSDLTPPRRANVPHTVQIESARSSDCLEKKRSTYQSLIMATQPDQLIMSTRLLTATVDEHKDPVAIANRGEALFVRQ